MVDHTRNPVGQGLVDPNRVVVAGILENVYDRNITGVGIFAHTLHLSQAVGEGRGLCNLLLLAENLPKAQGHLIIGIDLSLRSLDLLLADLPQPVLPISLGRRSKGIVLLNLKRHKRIGDLRGQVLVLLRQIIQRFGRGLGNARQHLTNQVGLLCRLHCREKCCCSVAERIRLVGRPLDHGVLSQGGKVVSATDDILIELLPLWGIDLIQLLCHGIRRQDRGIFQVADNPRHPGDMVGGVGVPVNGCVLTARRDLHTRVKRVALVVQVTVTLLKIQRIYHLMAW